MISVEQALELVLKHTGKLSRCWQIDTGSALGCILGEEVTSDIDSPPHDKSLVDGFAIHEADLAGAKTLRVTARVVAGEVPLQAIEPGTAQQIMTGVPIPEACAAVVMVEKTRLENTGGEQQVTLQETQIRPGQNIMRRGQSMRQGEVILRVGTLLRAIELGLLAEVGREQVWVLNEPSVAILPTGDEIVPIAQQPPPGKIRNSNSSLLASLALQAGGSPIEAEIVPDEASALLKAIEAHLDYDIILLSGGVSAGVHDLVPAALIQAGVKQVFHHVNLKPGKPLWFGFYERGETQPPCLVFGLPGNPVSGLVCFELFVRPALQKLRRQTSLGLEQMYASLTKEHTHRGERPAYWPAVYDFEQQSVTPLAWQGSGDLRTLALANALAYFPSGDRIWPAGEQVSVFRLPGLSP
jgi:molybdopterin molybdotransferase